MSAKWRDFDICPQCGKDITVTKAGVLRAHGHPARRCSGSGYYGQYTQRGMKLENVKEPERVPE